MNMVDFGNRLKQLRLAAGLTQKQLADKLRITKSVVSYYELQERSPFFLGRRRGSGANTGRDRIGSRARSAQKPFSGNSVNRQKRGGSGASERILRPEIHEKSLK